MHSIWVNLNDAEVGDTAHPPTTEVRALGQLIDAIAHIETLV